jgi:hypothetical protein
VADGKFVVEVGGGLAEGLGDLVVELQRRLNYLVLEGNVGNLAWYTIFSDLTAG